MNPRPFQAYNPTTVSTARDIVPAQNNLVDYEWCFPCNQPHNQSTCSNGVINQALMVEGTSVTQQDPPHDEVTQQQDQQQNETNLLNW